MKLHEFYPIMEMLNSNFENDLDWKVIGDVDSAIGKINNTKIRLSISPISYLDKNGLNLVFAVWNGADWSEKIGAISVDNASSLIGAITNAFKEHINEYEYDFLILIAKDDVETRLKLYSRIARRLAREQGMYDHSGKREDGDGNEFGLSVIAKKDSVDIFTNLNLT